MRRAVILPLLLLALVVAGCTSGSATRKTVTVVNTITSAPVSVGAPKTSSVIVVSPTSTPKPTPTTPKTTPKATPTVAPVAPIVKVDPLKADCTTILDAADIKKAIGTTVASGSARIRLGSGAHGVTGAIRCLYGSKDGGKTAPVRVRLTQYSSAAAAKQQVAVDTQTAKDGGAAISAVTVLGRPATLQLIAGGLIEMQYDSWTISVAVSNGSSSRALLTKGLPVLAAEVQARVIKGN